MATIEVKVPSIGDYKDVPVIDVLVKPGDEVKADDGLVTLESDKATMDVPAPAAGKVRELKVKVGDRVSEGSVVLTLDAAEARAGKVDGKADGANGAAQAKAPQAAPAARSTPPSSAPTSPSPASGGGGPGRGQAGARATPAKLEVKVPSIGDFKDVPVIEVLVEPGDEIAVDQGLVTLESEKATMDVPSPAAGKVKEVRVKVGDRLSEGAVVVVLETAGGAEAEAGAPPTPEPTQTPTSPETSPSAAATRTPLATAAQGPVAYGSRGAAAREDLAGASARLPSVHASPSVRKLARELGVDLGRVNGTGPRGRIVHGDVQGFVKEVMTGAQQARPGAGGGLGLDLPAWPKVDFARFGPVEQRPLTRIQKISGPALARNWVAIPHVTQFDEADITELEAFRLRLNEENAKSGAKVTLLAFLVKACVAALRRFPEVNASLEGDHLVLKRYFHIGFAADTPGGLVVPVLRNADQKGLLDVARELAELAARAREGKLQVADIQGGTFSISSLGGIGGTMFTPIINAPEVAILGVSRSVHKPVWDGEAFQPRLVLPLSLSYDHRVVDGALAARFTTFLAQVLADMRRAML